MTVQNERRGGLHASVAALAPRLACAFAKTRRTAGRFQRDERGLVAVIVGLTVPVFVYFMALSVDWVNAYSYKQNLQQSLDAAALAAAKQYGKTQDDQVLSDLAEAYYLANLSSPDLAGIEFSYEGVSDKDGVTLLRVEGTRKVKTYFGAALKMVSGGRLDYETITVTLSSEIAVQNRSVELALVLDTSGSMLERPASGGGKRKIDIIKEAATTLTEDFLSSRNDANIEAPIRFAVVPFSSAVNVGPQHKNATWMDTRGLSPVHNENLDWENWKSGNTKLARPVGPTAFIHKDTGQPLSRFYIYDNGVEKDDDRVCSYWFCQTVRAFDLFRDGWKGCVESRPDGLAVTDKTPSVGNPETLFVPTFAPDEYDGSRGGNNYIVDEGSSNMSAKNAMTAQRKIQKYFDKSYGIQNVGSNTDLYGPSAGCRSRPITPLTQTSDEVTDAIKELNADGATNIPEGLAWGWRVLSSGAPFTEGRPREERDNLKVIVLMTDGENMYGGNANDHNGSQYGTYGYGRVYNEGGHASWGRMFDASSPSSVPRNDDTTNYVLAMNDMVAHACRNIKSDKAAGHEGDGIVIFTIAFDLRDGTPVKKLLEDCASDGLIDASKKLYYDAKNAADIAAAFQSINEQISSLRIAN